MPLRTLPLLCFLFSLWLSQPLKPRLHREAGAEGPVSIFMLIVLRGEQPVLGAAFQLSHKSVRKKKSYYFHKDIAKAEQQVLATHHLPHPHPLKYTPSVMSLPELSDKRG